MKCLISLSNLKVEGDGVRLSYFCTHSQAHIQCIGVRLSHCTHSHARIHCISADMSRIGVGPCQDSKTHTHIQCISADMSWIGVGPCPDSKTPHGAIKCSVRKQSMRTRLVALTQDQACGLLRRARDTSHDPGAPHPAPSDQTAVRVWPRQCGLPHAGLTSVAPWAHPQTRRRT